MSKSKEEQKSVVKNEMSFWDKVRKYIRENWAVLTIVLIVVGWIYYNNQQPQAATATNSGTAVLNMGTAPVQVAQPPALTTTPTGLARYLRR